MATSGYSHFKAAGDLLTQADQIMERESGKVSTPQSKHNLNTAHIMYSGASAHLAMSHALGYF